jgi:PIN domain nuclease of toxin-antitoxin system
VKVLLDTHVLLWWLVDDPRLSERARQVVSDPSAAVYFSAVSSWELAIKFALGRLELPAPPRSFVPRVLQEQSIRSLDITHAHALDVADLPAHHRDPFDRLLVAQARVEKVGIVSGDPIFEEYGVPVVW